MDYESLFADAKASGNPQSFIANRYKDYGFDKSGGLYSDYKSWSEGQDKAEKSRDREKKNSTTGTKKYYRNYDRIPSHIGENELEGVIEKYPDRFEIVKEYDDETGEITYSYRYKK